MNPIPSRTRPLNSSAPMVLWLKPWESRSLPGLPKTKQFLFTCHDQTKRRFLREAAFLFVWCSSARERTRANCSPCRRPHGPDEGLIRSIARDSMQPRTKTVFHQLLSRRIAGCTSPLVPPPGFGRDTMGRRSRRSTFPRRLVAACARERNIAPPVMSISAVFQPETVRRRLRASALLKQSKPVLRTPELIVIIRPRFARTDA